MKEHLHTNKLINETSPYLLQHAHNPVNWKPWTEEMLAEAKEEGKLLLISIGYAACHWCHVMEEESFEDEEVAKLMNDNYQCIKVDREERPDVDQLYMNAVQIMTGTGGWPLNVVALPDGRPVWGGTYFQKEHWMQALSQIAKIQDSDPQKLEEYASRLQNGLNEIQLIDPPNEKEFHQDFYNEIIQKWKRSFDRKNGGENRSPKFMMPVNWNFLLRYSWHFQDAELQDHVLFTLKKISYGGVFDHIGGGFSRYSVDARWHVPHFEKMLYDNAQLVSLYSDAYKLSGKPWFKQVVYKTLDFIQEELTAPNGGFYASLDADSENTRGKKEEGAYYVWEMEEIKQILKNDFAVFADAFNVNKFGYWENDQYVLIRSKSISELAETHQQSESAIQRIIDNALEKLKHHRADRKKPALDDKIITSWNAMMISGYLKAYQTFGEKDLITPAEKCLAHIENNLMKDGRLMHIQNEKTSIPGYLEDYAFLLKAYIDFYEAEFDEKHLQKAENLMEIIFEEFQDKDSEMFVFTSAKQPQLTVKNIELNDNVIPASNSVLAESFFRLGKLLSHPDLIERSRKMLSSISEKISEYPQSYSNWLHLMLNFTNPYYEIVITGKQALSHADFMKKNYLPNAVMAASEENSMLKLFKDRQSENTRIFVCEDQNCLLPVEDGATAIKQIRQV